MNRIQLFNALRNLPPQDFEQMLFALKPPGGLIPSPEAPQMNRVKALLDWAEGSSGRGIDEVQDYLYQLRQGNLPEPALTLFNFQPYLESILSDEDYLGWQEVYTTTTVEGRKSSPQPRVSPRLKLRVETIKPKKEEQEAGNYREQLEQWDVLAGLRQYAAEHVLLIGKPGSGKSTSLERLLWEETDNALQNPTAKIPVLVKLRRCTSTIERLIQDFFSRHQLSVEISDIKYLLQQGKLLLLLDGLNELPETFWTEVANFRDRHRKTTPIIVSTRDLTVGGTLGITKALKMLPLTEPQMQEFVRGYLGEDGDRLFQQLKGDRLRKFAETPLLLWMLCRVFFQNGQVPTNLGLAFREFTQLYDQGTEEQKAIQEDAPVDSRKQWPKLLRYLAFGMHNCKSVDPRLLIPREEAEDVLTDCLQQESRTNARENAERWLQDLLDYHLLQPVMQPNHVEHVEFRHQLIQEYYAAEYLWRLLPELSDEQLKQDYLNYLKWTEPIALMMALVDEEAQALRVVKLAIDDVDLTLGAKLTGDIHTDLQNEMFFWLVEKIEDQITSQICTVRLLGETCSDHAVKLLTEKLISEENQELTFEIAFALGNIKNHSVINHLRPLLNEKNDLIVIAAVFALGKIAHQDTLEDLRVLLKHPNSAVREQVIEVLGDLGGNAVLIDLREAMQDSSSAVRTKAVEALGKLQDETSFSTLLEIATANHPISTSAFYLRLTAAKALAKINIKKARRELFQKVQCKDTEFEVCQHAVEALGELGESAIEEILVAINKTAISWQAAKALKEIGDKRSVPGLIRTLGNSIPCEQAAYVLGELGDSSAVPILVESLDHWYPQVREEAAEALGKIGDISVVPKLYELYEKEKLTLSSCFRTKLAIALGKLGDCRVRESLFELLKRKGFDYILTQSDRYSLFEALEKIADTSVVSALTDLLRMGRRQDRQQAVEILSRLRDETTIQDLIDALQDKDPTVRCKTIEALGKFDSQIILPKVFALFQESQDKDTQLAAYELLGHFRDRMAIEQLLVALDKADDPDIHFIVIESLVNLSNPYVKPYMEDVEKALRYRSKEIFLNAGLTYLLKKLQTNVGFYNYEIFHNIIPQGTTVSLYLSYAPADEALQSQLANHLALLKRQGVITSWSSHQILPGDDRTQAIHQQLNTADIILLLISPDAIADDTCYYLEFQRAVERHQSGEARVIPILLRPVDWQGSPFSQLDVLPKNHQPVTTWSNQDQAFQEIAEGIRTVAMEIRREKDNSGKMDAP